MHVYNHINCAWGTISRYASRPDTAKCTVSTNIPSNFGVIRSSKTGDILRLAPNFDNNQAYTANPMGYSSSMLRLFIRSADAEDRENLQILADGCKGNKYLSQACQAYADLS